MQAKSSRKSVTEKSQAQDRSKYRCPAPVTELINLVNSIPPDRKLPYSYDLLRTYSSEKLLALLDGVPKSFFDQYEDIHSAYDAFRRIRRVVHELAQCAAQPADKRDAYKSTVFYRDEKGVWWRGQRLLTGRIGGIDLRRWDQPPQWWMEDIGPNDKDALLGPERWPSASLTIGQDGRFAVRQEGWVTALIGVEADRLRECAVCQVIYWARQSNMFACSPRCSNALRQRRLRENRAQYEVARQKKRRKPKAATGRK